MSAYLIGRMTVTDLERCAEYKLRSPDIVAKYGGRYVARGGAVLTLEGPEETRRISVVEFPSMEHAKAFYDSEEYAAVRQLREGAAEVEVVVLGGVEEV
jgi:uncharacterized protein (DUF1330 family)